MQLKPFKAGLAIGALALIAGVSSASAQCLPTPGGGEAESCEARGVNYYAQTTGASQTRWCPSTTAGDAQFDYYYYPITGGQLTFGYNFKLNCTACRDQITATIGESNYPIPCP